MQLVKCYQEDVQSALSFNCDLEELYVIADGVKCEVASKIGPGLFYCRNPF